MPIVMVYNYHDMSNEFTTGGRGDDGDAYGIEIEVIYK